MLRMVLGSKRRPLLSEKVVDAVDFDSDAEKENPEQFVSEFARDSTELEPWVDWIKCATHDVEEKCKNLDITSWVDKARALKWSLAQRIISQEASRWSRQIFAWDPELHFPGLVCKAKRRQAQPKVRWIDDISDKLDLLKEMLRGKAPRF